MSAEKKNSGGSSSKAKSRSGGGATKESKSMRTEFGIRALVDALGGDKAAAVARLEQVMTGTDSGKMILRSLVSRNTAIPQLVFLQKFAANSPHGKCHDRLAELATGKYAIFPEFNALFPTTARQPLPVAVCVPAGSSGPFQAKNGCFTAAVDAGSVCRAQGNAKDAWTGKDTTYVMLWTDLATLLPSVADAVVARGAKRRPGPSKVTEVGTANATANTQDAPEAPEVPEVEEQEASLAGLDAMEIDKAAPAPAPAPAIGTPDVEPSVPQPRSQHVQAVAGMDIPVTALPNISRLIGSAVPGVIDWPSSSTRLGLNVTYSNAAWNILPEYMGKKRGLTSLFSRPFQPEAVPDALKRLASETHNPLIMRMQELLSLEMPFDNSARCLFRRVSTDDAPLAVKQRNSGQLFVIVYAPTVPVMLSVMPAPPRNIGQPPIQLRLTALYSDPLDMDVYYQTGQVELRGLVAIEAECFTGTFSLQAVPVPQSDEDGEEELQEGSALVIGQLTDKVDAFCGNTPVKLGNLRAMAEKSEKVRSKRDTYLAFLQIRECVPADAPVGATGRADSDHALDARRDLATVFLKDVVWRFDPRRRFVVFQTSLTREESRGMSITMRRLQLPGGGYRLLLQVDDFVAEIISVAPPAIARPVGGSVPGNADINVDFDQECKCFKLVMLPESPLHLADLEAEFHALYQRVLRDGIPDGETAHRIDGIATRLYGERVSYFRTTEFGWPALVEFRRPSEKAAVSLKRKYPDLLGSSDAIVVAETEEDPEPRKRARLEPTVM